MILSSWRNFGETFTFLGTKVPRCTSVLQRRIRQKFRKCWLLKVFCSVFLSRNSISQFTHYQPIVLDRHSLSLWFCSCIHFVQHFALGTSKIIGEMKTRTKMWILYQLIMELRKRAKLSVTSEMIHFIQIIIFSAPPLSLFQLRKFYWTDWEGKHCQNCLHKQV